MLRMLLRFPKGIFDGAHQEIRDILAEAGLSVPLARIRALLNEEGKKEEGNDESSLGSL